ncbi:hypothetical protein OPQ81_008097 [Rhizoctonia solani]|nr:hypothetical protein OPQ81_008097 [Rhizoctonia solani]
MPLPVPLSTPSSFVTIGYSTATCSLCLDILGRPLSFNKTTARKHIDSATHLANVKGLKSLQQHRAVLKPKSSHPSVQVDTAVETPSLGFTSTPSLLPNLDVSSIHFEEFLSAFEFPTPTLGAPSPPDAPTTNNTLYYTSDDLFEDSIAHGQPLPGQCNIASDNDHQSELSDYHFSSDSEEEDRHFFQGQLLFTRIMQP